MSRSVVKSSTKTITKLKKPIKNNKKCCEDGLQCKYIHEYQHQLEYYHEDMKKLVPFSGKGHKLGTAGTKKRSSPAVKARVPTQLKVVQETVVPVPATAPVQTTVRTSIREVPLVYARKSIAASSSVVIDLVGDD
jgi:hypothetical protein